MIAVSTIVVLSLESDTLQIAQCVKSYSFEKCLDLAYALKYMLY